MKVRQTEITKKTIGNYTFYIRPFPAFTAAKLSADLVSVIGPLLSGLAPMLGSAIDLDDIDENGVGGVAENLAAEGNGIMDLDIEEALPSITNAFASLSGEKFEKIMRQLLVDNNNISVGYNGLDPDEDATGGEVVRLDYELSNEVFCGEVQDMFILCFEVIRLNYNGFFKKLGALFGNQKGTTATAEAPNTKNTED